MARPVGQGWGEGRKRQEEHVQTGVDLNTNPVHDMYTLIRCDKN